MSNYILIDLANVFFRARHAIKGDNDIKLGMAFHITLNAMRKAWRDFDGDHVIFCLEGRSWRKDIYKPYKAQRAAQRAAHTVAEAEAETMFWEAFDTFAEFIRTKTNATVLQHPNLEADDLIAGWIQNHPDDNHIIISTDGDFYQLLASNVKQYNGVTEVTITRDGHFDKKGKPIIDRKTKKQKGGEDPEWILFEKCIRGDKSDNIFSAYPGVRKKGTKNKVGLLEAFADKDAKGFAWNNLMLQRFMHHDGTEHRVLDDYTRNKNLIDLTAQPDNIKQQINETIAEVTTVKKDINQVGIRLIKFCTLYDLKRVIDQVESFATPLNARYKNEHNS